VEDSVLVVRLSDSRHGYQEVCTSVDLGKYELGTSGLPLFLQDVVQDVVLTTTTHIWRCGTKPRSNFIAYQNCRITTQ
jgi:hypothetical protein